jgi:ATP-dependent Lhr-like helicase
LWHPYPVVAHHGSLNRRVREEAETVMKEADVAVCVATSTLEIGIDIGDIDLIVLAELPWSILALLQRIGRGNRRENLIHAIAVATTEEERIVLEAMFETAATGALPVESYEPDLSVAVQQTFSYLYQHGEGASETELLGLLSFLCSENEAKLILRHLRQGGWVEWRTGHWFASTRLMDMGEKGRIHSNIPDSQTYRVIDINSGKEIGSIAGVFDGVFVLAQRAWQVVSVAGAIIKARRFKGKASAPLFRRHKNEGAFYYLLPPDLKRERDVMR